MSCYHKTDQSVISSNPLTKLLLCQEKQLKKDGDMIYHGAAERKNTKAKKKKKKPSSVYTATQIYTTITRLNSL